MPSPPRKKPSESSDRKFSAEARRHLNETAEQFKGDLREVASALARHSKMDSVSERHVDEAFQSLAASGLQNLPLWRRPAFEGTLGGGFIATAVNMPDIIGYWSDALEAPFLTSSIYVTAGWLLFAIAGAFLSVHAWFRGKSPTRLI